MSKPSLDLTEALTSRLPKSVTALREYSGSKFVSDLIAGVTVGLVALPLAMAFGIASGVTPQSGIYCAVVAGFLISALGGSTTQIGGPTGAFVVVVSGIVQKHGMDGLFMCTLMAGVILLLLGATGLGTAVKYFPRPVVIGFTNGIAVLIASTQIKDFFGLDIERVPGEFADRMWAVATHWHTLDAATTSVAVGSLVILLVAAKWLKKVPGPILVMVLGTAAVAAFAIPTDTIASRFGEIPSGLPKLEIPTIRVALLLPLLSPAMTVAMLGAIESLLSAVVADRMSKDKHNPNVELVAQGVANLTSPLFGGLPATGAIARTATNIRSGAKTPVAGMIHALTLLGILAIGTSLAERIPLAVLAAILLVVAYNMGEWSEIPDILRQTKADAAVWAITFVLTVFADLTVAVEAGMVLAALLYIRRVTTTTTVARVTPEYIQDGLRHSLQLTGLPDDVAIYRIHGPFLFGSTDKLEIVEDELPTLPRIVILRLRNMTALDSTGLHAMESLYEHLKSTGRTLILCGLRGQPANLIKRFAFASLIGEENVQPDIEAAVVRARMLSEGTASEIDAYSSHPNEPTP